MNTDPQRASDMALAHSLSVTEALVALFITHPNPALLLQTYEAIAQDHADHDPFSGFSEEAIDYAKALRERLLEMARANLRAG